MRLRRGFGPARSLSELRAVAMGRPCGDRRGGPMGRASEAWTVALADGVPSATAARCARRHPLPSAGAALGRRRRRRRGRLGVAGAGPVRERARSRGPVSRWLLGTRLVALHVFSARCGRVEKTVPDAPEPKPEMTRFVGKSSLRHEAQEMVDVESGARDVEAGGRKLAADAMSARRCQNRGDVGAGLFGRLYHQAEVQSRGAKGYA